MHAFWLVLTYDLLEDRRIDDVIIKTFFNSLLYKTNRFQVAVRLFSNRSQRTSKCGKNISDTLGCASCATFGIHLLTWQFYKQLKLNFLSSRPHILGPGSRKVVMLSLEPCYKAAIKNLKPRCQDRRVLCTSQAREINNSMTLTIFRLRNVSRTYRGTIVSGMGTGS